MNDQMNESDSSPRFRHGHLEVTLFFSNNKDENDGIIRAGV